MENHETIRLSQYGIVPNSLSIKQPFFKGVYVPTKSLSPSLEHKKNKETHPEDLSDFQAFLIKSNQQGKNHYPSAFKFIRIELDRKEEIENIDQINFPILSFSKKQLAKISVKILTKFKQDVPHQKLQQLVNKISLKYNNISYHNFSHGFSLMHLLYNCFKMDHQFSQIYSSEQIFFALLAALAHDISHPGTNNSFQVKMQSRLADVAGNVSVLEKMHIATFFNILKEQQHVFFKGIKNPLKIKQMMTKLILATDVSKHFNDLTVLKQTKDFLQTQQKRIFALQQVFHACDIGNPCVDFDQYLNWASLLTYEFHQQTLLEQKNGLQVTQFLKYKGVKQFYKGQIGFINNLVFPLWKQLSVRWEGLSPLVVNIQSNIDQLNRLLDEENP